MKANPATLPTIEQFRPAEARRWDIFKFLGYQKHDQTQRAKPVWVIFQMSPGRSLIILYYAMVKWHDLEGVGYDESSSMELDVDCDAGRYCYVAGCWVLGKSSMFPYLLRFRSLLSSLVMNFSYVNIKTNAMCSTYLDEFSAEEPIIHSRSP